MNLCSKIVTDPRRRSYIAPVRVVAKSENIRGAQLLLQGEFQNFIPEAEKVCLLPPGAEILLDFGSEIAGGVRLVTAPNAGRVARVLITFGESVSEALGVPDSDHAIHQTELCLPPTGATEYGGTGFRFVRLVVPAEAEVGLELTGICAVLLFHDLERIGRFESDDERLNRIWEVGADTVHLCMQDFIYDGIKRDRMVWMGDLYPEMRTIFQLFHAPELVAKSIDFALGHTAKENWINQVSSYSAWFLISLDAYCFHTADHAYLQRHAAEVYAVGRKLMACIGADGGERLDGMRFLDWPTSDDLNAVHVGLQGLLAWSLACAARLGRQLGNDGFVAECEAAVAALRRYPCPATANKSAVAMLVAAGMIAPEEAERRVLGVEPETGLSTFFGTFILDARAQAGNCAGALESVRRYWGGMLACGATTFWEHFDLRWVENAGRIDQLPQPGKIDIHREKGDFCYRSWRHSLCHGWAGGVTAFLSQNLLGVQPLEAGFKKVAVRPNFCGLKSLSGAVPTPWGPIEIEGTPERWHVRKPAEIQLV